MPASPARATGTVVAYPLVNLDAHSNYTASPTADTTLSMTVGGTAVNVQDNLNSAQARFAVSGSQTVVITDSAGVTSARIRPLAFGMTPVIAGNTITFTLSGPENFAVDINGVKDALLVFADPLEVSPPQPTDSNVRTVTSFSGVNNTGSLETSALQSAINYVSSHSSTTPILYFPAGVYRTALLTIGSNVQVYLASGAVILADGNESDYTSLPGTVGSYASSAVLAVRGASNVKIFGRGLVDGNGYNLHTTYNQAMGIFDIFTDGGTSGLTVNDVMFTNSVMWQSHFQGSQSLAFTNVKFNNPVGNLGNQDDAFKINGSKNVTFTGGWLSSRDDAITFATTGTEAIYNTAGVSMTGTVIDSSGTASATIRFADLGSGQTMTGMNVSNIYDISYGRGMELRGDGGNSGYQGNWGTGTVLDNWDVESPAPIVHFGAGGSANVTISGITISNFTMPAGSSGGEIQGDSGNSWNNIHFSDIVIGGAVESDLASLGLTINSYATRVDVSADSAKTDLALPTASNPETTTTTSIASGYTASAATDGSFGTFFKSATSPTFPQYVTVTWPTSHTFSGVTVVCDWCQGQAPKNWLVEVSTNGTTGWTQVGASGDVSWRYFDSSNESRLVSFPAQTAKAVRIKLNSANNSFGQYQLDELEVSPANGTPTTTTQAYVNAASNLCLDDPSGSTTPSTFVDVENCTGAAQQQFTYTPSTETLTAEGLCLDSYGGGASPGTQLDLYTCWGTGYPSQQWTVNSAGQIISVESGLCVQEVGSTSGSLLQLQNCDSTNSAQIWGPFTVKAYKNTASSLCLDDPGASTTPSTFADVEACSGAAQQAFAYDSITGTMIAEGLCLDSYGGGNTPGTQLDLYTCHAGYPSQQWTVTTDGEIVSGESGLCVQENGATSGSQLALQYCDTGNHAQVWTPTP